MSVSIPQTTAPAEKWNLTMRQRQNLHRVFFLYVPLAFFMIFALFPFAWMGISSITIEEELFDADRLPWMITTFTFDHYTELLAETEFLKWIFNSLFVGIIATAISVTVGALAGYSLARLRFAGASTLGMGIITTYLVPASVLFLPLAYVFNQWGLHNTRLALILAYPTHLIPFCTWFMLGYFKNIPAELEESAIIDGCTRIQAFFKIVV